MAAWPVAQTPMDTFMTARELNGPETALQRDFPRQPLDAAKHCAARFFVIKGNARHLVRESIGIADLHGYTPL